MKKGKFALMFVLLCGFFVAGQTVVLAATTGSLNLGSIDPVRFYVVTDDIDGPFDLDLTFYDFGVSGGTLQYSIDNSSWIDYPISSGVDITTANHKEIVYLKLRNPPVTAGTVNLTNFEKMITA